MLERAERRRIERRGLVAGPAERPRPDLDPGTDLLPKIKHIVVLMMENHSYDNYLGTLAGRGEGLPVDDSGVPNAVNKLSDGREFTSWHLPSTSQTAGNPTQTWNASHIADADDNCGGFAEAVFKTVKGADPAVPMGYWTEADLPFYHGLAKIFPVADRWFCSCLGPTFPNRRFLISGTAHGLIDDLPWDLLDYPAAGTIFDLLTKNHINWVNYHNVHPVRVLLSRLLGGFGLPALLRLALVGRWLPEATNAFKGNKSFTADLYPLGIFGSLRHLRTTQRFFDDAKNGKLPPVSIVDPDFGLYSEENPQDIQNGEAFSAKVINAVMRGPDWESTLLIWTYDEHGGYYDHVPPPPAVAPDDVPARNWQLSHRWVQRLLKLLVPKLLAELHNADDGPVTYDRYGYRVPAVIVSPYARKDCVLHDEFDHTSILKLIEEKWNLPPLTRRDAAATSPLGALDLDAPPAFLTPPRDLPAAGAGGFHFQATRGGILRSARRS
jgi:phospholipase C